MSPYAYLPILWPPVDAGAMLEALDAPLLIKIHNVETKQELFSVPTTLGWVWSSGSTRAVHATSKGGARLKVYCSSITLGELLVLPSGDLSGGRVAGAVLAQTLFELYDQDGSDEVDPAGRIPALLCLEPRLPRTLCCALYSLASPTIIKF